MTKWGILFVAAATLLVAFTGSRPFAQTAENSQTIIELSSQPPAWLHVEVATNYGWFWQKSSGHAWVTAGKQDTMPVNVGKLCIRLAAHDTTLKCEPNTHDIVLQEKKKGIQIKKCTAVVSAWAENPALDTVTVQMEP